MRRQPTPIWWGIRTTVRSCLRISARCYTERRLSNEKEQRSWNIRRAFMRWTAKCRVAGETPCHRRRTSPNAETAKGRLGSVILCTAYGLNSSHHYHLVVARRVPDGRLWFWVQIARAARNDRHHHFDSLVAGTDLRRGRSPWSSPRSSCRLTLPLADLFCSLVFGLPQSGIARALRTPDCELFERCGFW